MNTPKPRRTRPSARRDPAKEAVHGVGRRQPADSAYRQGSSAAAGQALRLVTGEVVSVEDLQWAPRSLLAIIDGVDAARWALILVEVGKEEDINAFADWFVTKARGNPTKLDQVKRLWVKASWAIALGMQRAPDGREIILLSFFDGIGAAYILDQHFGKLKAAFAWWEIDGACRRVVEERLPWLRQRGDLTKDSADDIAGIIEEIDPDGKAIIVVTMAPPCQDFSLIRSDGPGHRGKNGGLFLTATGFVDDIKRRLPRRKFGTLAENTAMRKEDAQIVSDELDCQPILASDFGWISRPRLFWMSVRRPTGPGDRRPPGVVGPGRLGSPATPRGRPPTTFTWPASSSTPQSPWAGGACRAPPHRRRMRTADRRLATAGLHPAARRQGSLARRQAAVRPLALCQGGAHGGRRR